METDAPPPDEEHILDYLLKYLPGGDEIPPTPGAELSPRDPASSGGSSSADTALGASQVGKAASTVSAQSGEPTAIK